LFHSTIKLTMSIAKKQSEHLKSNTIEWSDLLQEGMIAAQAGVAAYNPDADADGGEFSTYVHRWITGGIRHWLSEQGRTVSVPRTKLDRFTYVTKAIEDMGLLIDDIRGGRYEYGKFTAGRVDDYTLDKIAQKATEIVKGQKHFTPEEVSSLIVMSQEAISMDLEVGGEGDVADTETFGDTIASPIQPVDEQIDARMALRRMMSIFQRYTSPEEYTIMELRYGFGSFKSYLDVSYEYTEATGKPMNHIKVKQIEKRVCGRILIACQNDPDLMQQFDEIQETIEFITE